MPSQRAAHAATKYDNMQLIIFGGAASGGKNNYIFINFLNLNYNIY